MATDKQQTILTLKSMQEALANPVPWIGNTTAVADNTRVLNNYESVYSGNAEAISIKKGKVTKEMTSFNEIAIIVIAELEGGYYHPNMLVDGRVKDPRYGGSGETLFGLDRLKGGKDVILCEPCKKFWSELDRVDAANRWKWLYIPPDPLRSKLFTYTSEIMEPIFNKSFNSFVKNKDLQNLIKSDGRLYFNFVYAQWNGPGWFKGFAKEIEKAYDSGIKDAEKLAALFVRLRKNNIGIIGNSKNNSLIAQGGDKISKIIGLA
jgi:hypothetical protein